MNIEEIVMTANALKNHPTTIVRNGLAALGKRKPREVITKFADPSNSGVGITRRESIRGLFGIGAGLAAANSVVADEPKIKSDELARVDGNRQNNSTKTNIEELRDDAIDLIQQYQKSGKLDHDTAKYLTEYVNDQKYFDSRLTPADIENIKSHEEALVVIEKDGGRDDELDDGLVDYLRSPKGVHDRLSANKDIVVVFINNVRSLKDLNDRQDIANDMPDSEIVDLVSKGASVFTNALVMFGGMKLGMKPREILESLSKLERHQGNPDQRIRLENAPPVVLRQIEKVVPNATRDQKIAFISSYKGLMELR